MLCLSETRAAGLEHQKKSTARRRWRSIIQVAITQVCVLLYGFERVSKGLRVRSSYSGYVVPAHSRL